MTDQVTSLNNENFDEFISSNPKVIVDFYADWCGPCKMFAPVFHEAAAEIDGIEFASLNVDEATDIAEKYEVRSIPTVIGFDSGNLAKKQVGALSKSELQNLFK